MTGIARQIAVSAGFAGSHRRDASGVAIETAPSCIRADMGTRLPAAVQPFLTWLTACPSPGERERSHTTSYHLWTSVLLTGLGASGSFALVALGGAMIAALPLTLLATLSGLGKLQAVIYHHCAHGTVLRTRRSNDFVGDAISIALLLKAFEQYRAEHLRHHGAAVLFSPNDEFAHFVFRILRLTPGMGRAFLWRRLLWSLISPLFHARFLAIRLKSCATRRARRDCLALLAWGATIAAVSISGTWIEFAVAWILPVTFFLQVTTVFRILCEHRIPEGYPMLRRDRAFVCTATAGVFLGTPVPPLTRSRSRAMLLWFLWWVRMLTGHLLARVTVLVGDAPLHDFHHRHPMSTHWANAAREREREAAASCPGFPKNYIEYWGMLNAVSNLLESLSRLPTSSIADG